MGSARAVTSAIRQRRASPPGRSRAAVLVALSLGFAGPALAAGCDSPLERLAEGDWSGTWQKETDLRGGDANFRMDYKLHGTVRFHVNKEGDVEGLSGDFNVDAPVSFAAKESWGSAAANVGSKLALAEGQRNSSQLFRAESGGSVAEHGATHSSSGSQDVTANAAAAARLEFHLVAASCDSGSGVLDSPTFQVLRDLAGNLGATVALDTTGTWTVTNSAMAEKAKRVREQTRSALSACPSFLSDSDRCQPDVKQIYDEILEEQDAALRDCLAQAWMEEVSKVVKVWIDEAIVIFRANTKSGASACFMQPYIGKAMKLMAWFELLVADRCDRDQQQKALFDAILDLQASYARRIANGESVREVFGLPCPALDKDPAHATATQQFLDELYKQRGLTPPKPLIVR
jgi:hypothetical protein